MKKKWFFALLILTVAINTVTPALAATPPPPQYFWGEQTPMHAFDPWANDYVLTVVAPSNCYTTNWFGQCANKEVVLSVFKAPTWSRMKPAVYDQNWNLVAVIADKPTSLTWRSGYWIYVYGQ